MAGLDGRQTSGVHFIRATALSFALTALADFLFFGQRIGWTVGLFIGAVALAIVAAHPAARRRVSTWVITFATLGLAAASVDAPTALRVLMAASAIAVLAMTCAVGWTADTTRWAERLGWFAMTGWLRCMVDQRIAGRAGRRTTRSRPSDTTPTSSSGPRTDPIGADGLAVGVARWVVPVGLSLVFVGLFALANPVIERWVEQAGDAAAGLPELINVGRIVFWMALGLWMWALVRGRPIAMPGPIAMVRDASRALSGATTGGIGRLLDGSIGGSPGFVTRCLVMFNAVFAIETMADLIYLWGGAALPDGMTYAQYAHRGAYPLIATALLAAAFVLVAFRRTASGEAWRTGRWLVYAWLAQNVLLVVSAAWRLNLYVEVYQLSRWRVAAAIWMLLVAVGLVLILWRIVRGRDNAWLVRSNIVALVLVLYACCFIGFDQLIAGYNVAHCREMNPTVADARPIDLNYLESLGVDALPALDRLADGAIDPTIRDDARSARDALVERLRFTDQDWRAWTWKKQRLRDALALTR